MTPDFASLSEGQRKDRANELREMIKAQNTQINYYFSIVRNPEALKSRVAHLKSVIERSQKELEDAEDTLLNAKQYRLDAIDREEELKAELVRLENQSKIDKLMRLAEQLNAAGVTRDDLVALSSMQDVA